MAEAPYMKLWIGDYLRDTYHLSTIEHGAYFLLLMTMWTAGGSLQNDDKLLAKYARLTKGQWLRVKPILMPFFTIENEQLFQSRLTKELNAVRQLSQRQSNNRLSKVLKTNEPDPTMVEPKQANGATYHSHSHSHKKTPPKRGVKEAPKNSGSAARKGTVLSEDWILPEEWRQWAKDEFSLSDEQITYEAETMRDWSLSNRNAKKDWRATWRGWIRRDRKPTNPQKSYAEMEQEIRNAGA